MSSHFPASTRPFAAALNGLLCLVMGIPFGMHAAQIDAWILAGQSNAEGYGITESPVPGLAPPDTLASIGRMDLNVSHPGVRFFQGNNDYNSVSASAGKSMPPRNTWHAMTPYEGIAFDWGTGRGGESGRRFGPELTFGYQIRQAHGADIAIIKYARSSASLASGTAVNAGVYNDFDPSDSRPNQYDRLLATIGAAVNTLPAGDSLRVHGVLWMQGETDAGDVSMGNAYQANLAELVSVLRSDLSVIAANHNGRMVPASSWDQLKFFIGTIFTPSGNQVRSAQQAVADADPHAYLVDGRSGISMMSTDDWGAADVHYDTAGQVLLGERFATAVVAAGIAEPFTYETWASGAAFGMDTNSDGIGNGMAWVLGAPGPSANAVALLPTLSNTDPTHFIFTYRRRDVANSTTITVQYGSNLSGWTSAAHDGDNVIITPTDNFHGTNPGIDKVEVRIKRTLAPGGKLFARLVAVEASP